jgi:hypothetical protein
MRSAFAKLLLAGLLLGGCEDGKPVAPPPAPGSPPAQPAAENPPAPAAAESPTPPAVRPPHGATGVGDTAPAPERAPPPKGATPPAPTEWGKPGSPRPPELEGRRVDAGVPPG